MTAVELLTAYLGQSAEQYEPYFQCSKETEVVSADIYAVGIEGTSGSYSGTHATLKEVNNILRFTTADGFEGVSGVDASYEGQFSVEFFGELERAVAAFADAPSLDPVVVGRFLEQRHPELSHAARSSIDIALWDLAARRAEQPLYKLFGGTRDEVGIYASLPFYESLSEYVEAVKKYGQQGYEVFKLHVWGSIEKDIELVELMQKTFSDTNYRFMIDLEGVYDFDDALRLGKSLDDGLFIWFEEPMADDRLQEYARLRDEVETKIIPGGRGACSSDLIRQGVETSAWDAGRFDVTRVGGISKALALLKTADDVGLPIELQSWGHSLTQIVNLHLILANTRTRFFEVPIPKQPFEWGMKNGSLVERGKLTAPDAAGLGIQVDWEILSTADFYACSKANTSSV